MCYALTGCNVQIRGMLIAARGSTSGYGENQKKKKKNPHKQPYIILYIIITQHRGLSCCDKQTAPRWRDACYNTYVQVFGYCSVTEITWRD